MNQAELAASIGFKQSSWSAYETGASTPNFKDLLKIIEFFNIDATDLLQRELDIVHLNPNSKETNNGDNVHLIVHPNVHLKQKKAQKEPCQECKTKDSFIAVKDQLLHSKDELIEQLQTNIKLLQNQIDQMEYETVKREQTHYPQSKEAKSA